MTKPTIVLTSAVPWDYVARPQHFAQGLAERGWPVLFVDGPITWISPIKNKALRSRLVPYPPTRDVVQSKALVRVLTPVAQIPFGNMVRAINRWNQHLLATQIRNAMPGPYILLSMLPGSLDLIPHLHPLAVLYDCVDFHAEFSGFIRKDVVNQMEADLVHLSRTVFATADILQQRMEELHGDVRLLPNGAQVEHFMTTTSAQIHPLLKDIAGPRVGMIGGIGSWTDLDLAYTLAKLRPNLQVVFVGPIETDISRFSNVPNVHFLGRQPYAELPQFLAGFEATMSLFRVEDKVAQSVNPVKIYEYLASGKEVLATPIPECKKMADKLWLVRDGEAAASALDRILAGEQKTPNSADRQAFSESNSWKARVDQIERALYNVLPMGKRGKA